MKIEKNEGLKDRIIRALIVLTLFAVSIFFVEGSARIFCIVMGIVMTATTAMGFCPLYLVFGVNTCGKKK